MSTSWLSYHFLEFNQIAHDNHAIANIVHIHTLSTITHAPDQNILSMQPIRSQGINRHYQRIRKYFLGQRITSYQY